MNDIALARQRNGQILSHCLDPNAAAELMRQRPNLLSDTRIFLAASHRQAMADAVSALHRVAALPGWQEAVLARAPASARHATALSGVFFGYDFHVCQQGVRLIEINTNAGGGFINAYLLGAQQAGSPLPNRADVEADFLAMFRAEWALADKGRPLAQVAIVDETPDEQYLNPDFELCQQVLAQAGIGAIVCPPSALRLDNGRLMHEATAIDLVYNRLTDFSLDMPAHRHLRQAWEQDCAQFTPHPRAHALHADKHNLVLLSDPGWLASIGVDTEARKHIAAVLPVTEMVESDNGEALWARRKGLFFKPVSGYGGKAVYRGMNVTKRVFAEILAGNYVAQELATPESRLVEVAGQGVELKYDIRCYAYQGRIQLIAARVWQGQTTNFRTPGGGFAPVVIV
ncbi:MAG: hypothetical protein EKK46_18170 [Rhodocyclaceae bacterium]|nr:MAG: hypothetical protein EKK46_18170 [Rhodocyclaceae bacterium]